MCSRPMMFLFRSLCHKVRQRFQPLSIIVIHKLLSVCVICVLFCTSYFYFYDANKHVWNVLLNTNLSIQLLIQ